MENRHPSRLPVAFPVERARRRIDVSGRVQGVGFRPFVYRLAGELCLGGLVGNDTHGAFIEIEGEVAKLEEFIRRLQSELPPLAQISSLRAQDLLPRDDREFTIRVSEHGGTQDAEITPDVATCSDCLRELFDPYDRRYHYPFINCTNCGPRYSIIRAVPYDRTNTTMACFTMCPRCQAEYDDPADRRFHAQPNACPVCGPGVWLTDADGRPVEGDAIRECARLLRDGRIVAIKGIGGFHLACRADDDRFVARLRQRKGREAKPLALMVPSLEVANRLVWMSESAVSWLTGPERPIVLARKRSGTFVADAVAPSSDCFGLMLPYTPLHYLLFAEGLGPLVMTSGNPSEEPLCSDNDEAFRRLSVIADGFLFHDRAIQRRVDDSVVMVSDRNGDAASLKHGGGQKSKSAGLIRNEAPTLQKTSCVPVSMIRRARGYAPAPLELNIRAPRPVLSVGGEMKSAVCLLAGNRAVVSEHLGELSNAEAYRHFTETIEQLKVLLRIEPEIVACDMHPDYAAARYAHGLKLPFVAVQHHHAHIVSCMAENSLTGPTIGIACDGTGYGMDGAIWGCEILIADEHGFKRAAHLDYYPLLGGDAGARQTWRPAAGLLSLLKDSSFDRIAPEAFQRIPDEAIAMARQRLLRPGRLPRTSSLGRLFDAVAFLLGLCDENRYEAEAAITLETAAATWSEAVDPLPYLIHAVNDSAGNDHHDWSDSSYVQERGSIALNIRPAIEKLLEKQTEGINVPLLAKAFHATVATMLGDAANRVAVKTGLNRVVLSGGCFANRLLTERLFQLLRDAGREVYVHRRLPAGDGGIALGQAVVAACGKK